VRESARARTERRDGGCCDCASKQAPRPIYRAKWAATRGRVCVCVCLRRASLPLLARWRRPRSPLARGVGRGEGPHATRAKRADRSVPKGPASRACGQTEAGKGKRPRAHGQTENGKKKKAGCWAHRNGQKARDQTHTGRVETEKMGSSM
jgi:hypothetical protein